VGDWEPNFFFRRRYLVTSPIRYGERVAIGISGVYIPGKLTNGRAYIQWRQRQYGINLELNPNEPSYEWEVRRGPASGSVPVGVYVSLFNRATEDYVVYCERSHGINLGWARACGARPHP
jgi:hypothetical protein